MSWVNRRESALASSPPAARACLAAPLPQPGPTRAADVGGQGTLLQLPPTAPHRGSFSPLPASSFSAVCPLVPAPRACASPSGRAFPSCPWIRRSCLPTRSRLHAHSMAGGCAVDLPAMAAPRLATAVAAARALKCSGPAAGARAWEANRIRCFLRHFTAFLLSPSSRASRLLRSLRDRQRDGDHPGCAETL